MDRLNIFKGKRVVVTGDTGFKGSWLCIWLKHLGADVYGFALPNKSDKDNFSLCDLGIHIKHQFGDIRNLPIKAYLNSVDPDFIFHLAAQPLVLESLDHPVATFETNVMGTARLLDAARNLKNLRSIVVVTSDKCYKNESSCLCEQDHLGGGDPYSASKACQDIVATSFYQSFFKDSGVGLATARAGNVIGGGDTADNRIVPDIIRAIEANKTMIVRHPHHIRPWQYVLEPLRGYLTLASEMYADPNKYSGAWNFGPHDDTWYINVNDLTNKILKYSKELYDKTTDVSIVDNLGAPQKEKAILKINPSKAMNEMNVNNYIDIDDTCRFVVEDYFYSGNFLNQRIDRIKKYEEGLKNEV